MKFEDHFYRGRWVDVSYKSETKKSPLGHNYVLFTTNHVRPVLK